MPLQVVPANFDPRAKGASHANRQAHKAARLIEHKVETMVDKVSLLDNSEFDTDPAEGVVKLKGYSENYKPLEAELSEGKLDARWGVEDYRLRENARVRILQWDDAGQHRKVTEDKTTGTLTVLQG